MVRVSLTLAATSALVLLLSLSHVSLAGAAAARKVGLAEALEAKVEPEPEPVHEPSCSALCLDSCCFFQNPAYECALCNNTMGCFPGAECYDLNDPKRRGNVTVEKPVSKSELGPSCSALCRGSCCYFGSPSSECALCNNTMGCFPGAECYDLGDPKREEKEKLEQVNDFHSPDGKPCKMFCKSAPEDACCSFSDPAMACSGCPVDAESEFFCNPEARCYTQKYEL